MKSLVLTPLTPPIPGQDAHGVYQRLRQFVGAVAQLSTQMHVLHFVPPDWPRLTDAPARLATVVASAWGTPDGLPIRVTVVPTAPPQETLRTYYLDGLIRPFQQPGFRRFQEAEQVAAVTRAIAEAPDLVFVHRLAAMGPLLASLRAGGRPLSRLFFDLDDVEHIGRWRAALQPPRRPGKLVHAAHALRLIGAEAQSIRVANGTFVCSELDRRRLRWLGGAVHAIPNAVTMPDLPASGHRPPADKTLLFLGDYWHQPNVHAAERLLTRIWPRIRAAEPTARLTIAGRGCEHIAGSANPPPGVTFPGFVPSLEALYAATRVACCPVLSGGGTRFKVIEAAGYAKPIVSTRLGAEGLDFADGADILLPDDDTGFAEACVTLLRDDGLCERLGTSARSRAAALYDTGAVQQRIVAVMQGSCSFL